MIGLLSNEEVSVFAQHLSNRTFVNDAVVFQPEQAQDVGITVEQQLDEFRQNPDSAKELIKVGESPAPEKVDSAELAAMTAVANVLLNLNETITK